MTKIVLIIILVIDVILWHVFRDDGMSRGLSALLCFTVTCAIWRVYLETDPFDVSNKTH